MNELNIWEKADFDMGWKLKEQLELFQKEYSITVNAFAYFSTDEVTEEQKNAYNFYKQNKKEIEQKIMKHLLEENRHAKSEFIPRELLIQRNGEYALLLEEVNNLDGGIALLLKPDVKVITQDEYL